MAILMPGLRFVFAAVLLLGAGIGSLSAADVEFMTQDLPWAVVDREYAPPPLEAHTSGACNSGGIGYAVVSGALPPGIQLSRLGYFSGIPTRTGTFEIAIRVSTGCSWTARHFMLTSTGRPILSAAPDTLEFRASSKGLKVLEQAVQISSTWPELAYRATSSVDWLTAASERGFTPRESSALAGDVVRIRVDATHLAPGKYQATVSISAWQAETLRVPIHLTVIE